ncbi:interferon-inducible GTPase 5-like [Sceloporus undulatus]|uniref:interferon-inducible GTPase 5-like n=1 Tax=Sceloporus undulatus TaxID=8520 RepID=UPI001C4CB8A1|nr:interferon-inducible GTPase 5-like [Sceloporus undulatus]XP_042311445.1 interferon-inducible GTPase 5-like [Sceloporus undulatus]XP_042311446.1 interferon-inducible GTPase 5-like [Sceloporus undulatus]
MGIAISKACIRAELEKMQATLNGGNIPDVAHKIQDDLDLLENTAVNIAVTGISGAGKSSLVNALRDMTDCEKGSAETGVTETTKKPEPYQYPLFPKITIWDLPGAGTQDFEVDKYLKKVNFSSYDYFFIVSGERFTDSDVKLACEIRKMEKKFCYVRTKVDNSINSEQRKPNFNEMDMLQKIREYCCENLKKAGEPSPRVFLVSRWDLSMYDFPLLREMLAKEVEGVKKLVLIMAFPGFSEEIVAKKKAAMEELIRKVSFLSCAIGVIPVPGLSLACDIGILAITMKRITKAFGLDEDSLRRLGNRVDIPVAELKSAIKHIPKANEITTEFVIDSLQKSMVWVTLTVIELALDFIPVLGSLVGGVGSFVTTFYMLKNFLGDVLKDAQNVRAMLYSRGKSPK